MDPIMNKCKLNVRENCNFFADTRHSKIHNDFSPENIKKLGRMTNLDRGPKRIQ
jgi:hypothetical protein